MDNELVEKRVNLDNISGYKTPMPNTPNEDFPDAESYLRDTEKRNETGEGPQAPIAPPVAAKPKVVTKEQMKSAGFDNLRDYLNATNAGGPLKRRGESKPKETPVNVEQSKEYPKNTNIMDRSKEDRDAILNLALRRAEAERTMKEAKAKKSSNFAKGGMTSKMASGGMTASRRGDGIAQRGKTRGKMC
jgi:hypothetical protein